MDQKSWAELATVDVKPGPVSWIRALDYVPAGTLLKFECKDTQKATWTLAVSESWTAGPDGGASTPAAANGLPITTAPLGALIAKIGGSTAANDGTPFCVGSFCVYKLGDNISGPLYLGVNITSNPIPTNVNGAIAVTISEAKP